MTLSDISKGNEALEFIEKGFWMKNIESLNLLSIIDM